ncbi:glutathione S-transferase [Skermanella stibiiresistens SB22]|uniref:Glutathione S-transferase n=1 Tax=Skermanella stibiiresistens SB22 TaxID=1385369 RepID=W9H4S8_9PROT|nr:glutathione S-transferase family protein [Skermanella stibiiresistens]EWY39796.1 glutathione S-transferase [Skermanella stibiiresistens SB22]
MGLLIEGHWHDQWYDTKSTGGAFKRQESAFRDWVTADGSSGFKAEPGRYHLYVSLACPWAHRTLIFRKLKKLEDAISVSVVEPLMLENGWELAPGADPVNGKSYLYQVYTEVKPDMTGRVTVPVLWDKQKRTIVSNESAEIIRMLNSEFNAFGDGSTDYYPADLRGAIDEINAYVYDRVNNGVYKTGFATEQAVYEKAFDQLFEALDTLEERLGGQRYLVGDRLTEADWRLFTTLVRFDAVYVGHFKCNLRRIADYPNLSNYLRELYQIDGVAETVSFEHIKRHYYGSHKTINPTGIVPKGPALDLDAPHDRHRF